MERLSILEIRDAVRGSFLSLPREETATGVSTDTRTLKKGDLFVALKGPRFDGHDYLEEAVDKGAAAAVVAKGTESDLELCRIAVPNPLQALGDLAAYYRKRLTVQVIGITGSNGKTTTKDMVHHVLSGTSEVVKSEGSFNNLIGLPLSIFRMDSRKRFAVLEMGTSLPGEISRLSKIARPHIAVITCINESHIEGLGSIEGVMEAKAEILHGLDEKGLLVVNADDPRCMAIAKRHHGMAVTFGFGDKADVRCVDMRGRGMHTKFKLADGTSCEMALLGRHNVMNALACLTVCLRTGMPKTVAAEWLSTFVSTGMRSQVARDNGIVMINDSYNANPASYRAAIDTLVSIKGRRHVLICGDMLELGTMSERLHEDVGKYAAEKKVSCLICVGTQAKLIGEEGRAWGIPADSVYFFKSARQACAVIENLVEPDDVILVKGSRAMGMESVAEAIKRI